MLCKHRSHFCVYRLPWLVSPRSLHEAQDVDEEIDEIEVEVDGRKDVLLRGHLVHDHVSVKDDEATEESSPAHRDDKLGSLAPEEHLHVQRGSHEGGRIETCVQA